MADLTILIPLDGTKAAELPLSLVGALKGLGSVRVRLLSVAETSDDESPDEEKEKVKAVTDYLDDAGSRVEARYGFGVECICRTGKPDVEIIEEAARPDVNLILMTTHGKTSAEPEHLGAVADRVVRGASCATLLVGPHASVPLEIGAITVPLDGSRLAAEALPVARAFAQRLGSRLRLIRALTQKSVDEEQAGSLVADVIGSTELTAPLYLEEAKLELETAAPVETAVLDGPAAEAILHDLKVNRPDLVIMTSHGRRGFVRWAVGSVTDRVIRGPVPVLVVRPAAEVGQRLGALLTRQEWSG